MDTHAWVTIASLSASVIITAIATWLVLKWQQQRKEVSYRCEIRTFLAREKPGRPGVSWDPNVKIFYGERRIQQLFPFRVTLRNTGNQALEELLIRFKANPEGEILSFMIGHQQRIEVGRVSYTTTRPDMQEVKIGFLNEGDEIEAYGIGTSDDIFSLIVTIPKPGVTVRKRQEFWTTRDAFGRIGRIFLEALSNKLPFGSV